VIDPAVLAETMAALGQPRYRAAQVYEGLTRRLAVDFDELSALPRALRAQLAERLDAVTLTPRETRATARGEARKTLFATRDGEPVEAVLMTYPRRATVCVSDHGVGIAREKQERIFERFYRAHTDTPHDYGGMGVGLYISREIIAQHGGTMSFRSEEGHGSRFCFSLPVKT